MWKERQKQSRDMLAALCYVMKDTNGGITN